MFKDFFNNMKHDQATDTSVGGYGAPANATPVPPPPAQQQANPAPAQAPGNDDNLDDFGYEKSKLAEGTPAAPAAQTQAADAKTKTQTVAPATEPVAGYGRDPVIATPPATTPPAAAEPIKLEYELDVKDLAPEETEKFKKIAFDHKLSKEVAQALVDMRKQENQNIQAELIKLKTDNENKIAQQKAGWHNELVTDPKFGGENYLHNLARVDKVLTTLMPDTKKVLTERKSMLPPYVMRDLLTVYNSLYSTDEFVGGQPPTPSEAEKESSPLDFYQ